ncbi:MAG: DegT/DnrJ/EryC1/StrS family aminotransferase, partial [Actinomycetota bacterium]|nr:DegT/DnrJ/EryC1/StrS family aminotransferase [Actinomycetota bacterium]
MSFEPGAPAPEGAIPLCVPEIHGREWDYIKECLDTNWVSAVGSFVYRFEGLVSTFVGTRHAVATVNGTAALHVALLAAGICPDDEVLVSDLTFIAPANAVRYAGAWPVFIDAEPAYWQMDPAKTVGFIEDQCCWIDGELRNKSTGRRIGAILPVHILGHPVDMDPIIDVARKFELVVIEDAAESLGARYKKRPVGSLGDVGCLSF